MGTHFALVPIIGLRSLALISTFNIGFVVMLLAKATPLHLSRLVCAPAIVLSSWYVIRTNSDRKIAVNLHSAKFIIFYMRFVVL